jgi:hypothetical protein
MAHLLQVVFSSYFYISDAVYEGLSCDFIASYVGPTIYNVCIYTTLHISGSRFHITESFLMLQSLCFSRVR